MIWSNYKTIKLSQNSIATEWGGISEGKYFSQIEKTYLWRICEWSFTTLRGNAPSLQTICFFDVLCDGFATDMFFVTWRGIAGEICPCQESILCLQFFSL